MKSGKPYQQQHSPVDAMLIPTRSHHYLAAVLLLGLTLFSPLVHSADNPSGQAIYKWVDEHGVVHFGERETKNSTRIDQDLKDITVIENAEETKEINKKAAGSLRRSYNSPQRYYSKPRGSSQVKKIKAKKQRCAYLSAKRNKYELNSPRYKYYGTLYRKECMF